MYIGNIITEDKVNVGNYFNITNSIEGCYNNIPTLVVGLNNVKDQKLDYMNRKLSDGKFWTFTKKESRKHNIIDISNFKTHCYKTLINNTKYIFIDPIQDSLTRIKKIINKIHNLDNIISYNHENKMLYIYSEKLIFGIDLTLCEYLGISSNKVKKKVEQKSKTFLSSSEIFIEYKEDMVYTNNEVKYIPLLHSIRYGKETIDYSNICKVR